MTLRTELAGRSITGSGTANEASGSSEWRTRSASSKSAYVRPRASYPQAHRLPFAWHNASASGTASTRAPAALSAAAASGEAIPAATIRRCDAGACAAFSKMRAWTPRSVSARSSSSAAHRTVPEDATESAGSTTMATPAVLPAALVAPAAARLAAAPAAVQRNWRRLSFLFTVFPRSDGTNATWTPAVQRIQPTCKHWVLDLSGTFDGRNQTRRSQRLAVRSSIALTRCAVSKDSHAGKNLSKLVSFTPVPLADCADRALQLRLSHILLPPLFPSAEQQLFR